MQEERRIAICVFDDIIEHASDGGGSLKYLDGFIGPCIAGCTDSDCDVRQAAVYGRALNSICFPRNMVLRGLNWMLFPPWSSLPYRNLIPRSWMM